MVEITVDEVKHHILTNWNEVNYSKFVEIIKAKDKPFIERLNVYCGFDCSLLKFEQIQMLMDLVKFMDSHELVEAFAKSNETQIEIGEQQYWKVEKAKQLLKDVNPFVVGAEIVDLFTSDKDGNGGEHIVDKPVTEVIPKVCFLLAQLSKFFERFKRLNDYKPTDDEIEAGLGRLTNLSSFGTPLSLARRSNMTVEQILMRPSEECYMMLLVDFEEAEYTKRLRKIKEDNAAIENSLRSRK